MSALRRCLLVVCTLATVAALGCDDENPAPHGSPVLLEVLWEVDGVPRLIWSRNPDAAVETVPADAIKIDFVFDRRLDGPRIEDTVNGLPVPKANPPITVGWPDMATVMSIPPFAFDVFYSSLPVWGRGTTSVFVQAETAGFPSATPVTFTLDPNGLTSVYGEPMDGPTEITVTTEPLAVSLPFSSATVATTYRAPIQFSTLGPSEAALMPFVSVTAGSQILPFVLTYDASDRHRLLVLSLCGGAWPMGVRVDVTVRAGAPDGFGRPLAAPVTGSFMTAPIAPPPVDGGCGFDAGDRDAMLADAAPADTAPADGEAPDAGVPDAADAAAQSN
jgi:hypothetical protein